MPFVHTGRSLQPLPMKSRALSQNVQQNPSAIPSQTSTIPPNIGINPEEFIAQGFEVNVQPYLVQTPDNLSPAMDSPREGYAVSNCPSLISGISTIEPATPVTRQNSHIGDTQAAANMSRYSSQSQSSDCWLFNVVPQPKSSDGQPFLGLGASMEMSPSISQSVHTTFTPFPSPGVPTTSVMMDRGGSNLSASSNSSQNSVGSGKGRSKDALERVILAGKTTHLAPKPLSPSATLPEQSQMSSKKKNGKLAVQKKAHYTRRQPRKVWCRKCKEHPEGFRGDHELRRHDAAKHQDRVKKWICVDAYSRGIQEPRLVPVRSLSDCKTCRSGKQYAAYYNAAAHLRRQHYFPKKPKGDGLKDSEPRAGKGGGEEPPMPVCMEWIRSVLVKRDGTDSQPEAAEDVLDFCPEVEDPEDQDASTSEDNILFTPNMDADVSMTPLDNMGSGFESSPFDGGLPDFMGSEVFMNQVSPDAGLNVPMQPVLDPMVNNVGSSDFFLLGSEGWASTEF